MRGKSIKGRQTGVFQTGGFPDLDLSFLLCPFLSLLGLSRFFWDFPDLLGDGPGIFPICPFPLSRPIKSTYEEQSRKGPRHNLDLSRKKWAFAKPRIFRDFPCQALLGCRGKVECQPLNSGAREGGRTSRKRRVSASKCLLDSPFFYAPILLCRSPS